MARKLADYSDFKREVAATRLKPSGMFEEFGRVALADGSPFKGKMPVSIDSTRYFKWWDQPYFDNPSTVDVSLPVMAWDSPDAIRSFLRRAKVPEHRAYNDYRRMLFTKTDIARAAVADMQTAHWHPRTFFSEDEAVAAVGFPLIAKSDTSFQSRGVFLCESPGDIADAKGKVGELSLFQEPLKIAREWRATVFRGKNDRAIRHVGLYLRVPDNKKSMSLRVIESKQTLKDAEKSHFMWYQQSVHRFPHSQALGEIARFYLDLMPGANFWGIDVAETTDGRLMFIEGNNCPGMVNNQYLVIFKGVYEDYYRTRLTPQTLAEFDRTAERYGKFSEREEDVVMDRGATHDLDGKIIG